MIVSLGTFEGETLQRWHLVEMSWQEQLDDNRLNCLRHIGDFDDGK